MIAPLLLAALTSTADERRRRGRLQELRGRLGLSARLGALRRFRELNPDIDPFALFPPAFWSWFGDSVVVDERGRPLELYHGTNDAGFHTFETGERDISGIYFTTDEGTAYSYLKGRSTSYQPSFYASLEELSRHVDTGGVERLYYFLPDKGRWDAELFESPEELREELHDPDEDPILDSEIGTFYVLPDSSEFWDEQDLLDEVNRWGPGTEGLWKGGSIYEAYLKIETPHVYDAEGRSWDSVIQGWTARQLDPLAKEAGADGLIIKNVWDHGSGRSGSESDVYAVFHPSQIKVHPGNRGTFSASEDSVVFGADCADQREPRVAFRAVLTSFQSV